MVGKYFKEKSTLEILGCPLTKKPLIYDPKNRALVNEAFRIGYPLKTPLCLKPEDAFFTETRQENGSLEK